jgi:phage gp36-like protein
MTYLTDEDLTAESFQRFITESAENDTALIDTAEKKAIAICKTFIGNRYDADAVFDEDTPVHDEFLASLIATITVYKLITRNAARKVSTDLKEDYQWALKQLEKIQNGSIILELPAKETIASDSLSGNNTNTDFYI